MIGLMVSKAQWEANWLDRNRPETFAGAHDFIYVEVYVWRNDDTGQRVLNAHADVAKRSIEVRLLVDEIGSLTVSE